MINGKVIPIYVKIDCTVKLVKLMMANSKFKQIISPQSKRIELKFVLLSFFFSFSLTNLHTFAHLTKIAITLPFIKLGPPDFARTSRA